MPKDNSTLKQKKLLRQRMLKEVENPVVMETHGGTGQLYRHCYTHIPRGIVFEKNPKKSQKLAMQRSSWSIYEVNVERALAAHVGNHLAINFLDVDPYSDPWPTLDAFFESERPRAEKLVVVVNDGMRQSIQYGQAWHSHSLSAFVQQYGNNLFPVYLEVCQELMQEKAAKAGYALDRFTGYYCGYHGELTHYAAVLRRG